jgi:transposase
LTAVTEIHSHLYLSAHVSKGPSQDSPQLRPAVRTAQKRCPLTWWYRVRDGTLRRSTFRQYMGVVRWMVRQQLEAGAACGCARTAGTCRELLALEPALWTFVRVEGVEPTNNAAERALRHPVLWRRTSHGTESEAGSRFVENILSVVATCRQQGRNVLEFLTDCCRASLEGVAPPRLLPLSPKLCSSG